MKNLITSQFEAYHQDASNQSLQAIIRPGYYYVGAIYPTNVNNAERIALVLWSQSNPVFANLQVYKFDLSTLFNYGSKSSSKHICPSELKGSVLRVSTVTPLANGFNSYPYNVEWEIVDMIARKEHFPRFVTVVLDSDNEDLLIAADSIVNESREGKISNNLQSTKEGDEIPDADIIENSLEIEDEEFLEELDQLLYDQQIAMAFDAEENELLQLLWDEQRTDKLEN